MQTHYPLNPTTGAEDQTQLPWTNGVPSTGTEGSYPPFALLTGPQSELINLITLAGETPSDGDMNQVTRAVRGGQLDFDATDIGTADAVICQIGLAHTQLAAGLPFTFIKGPAANTGNAVPTLTITDLAGNNGLTGTIVKSNGGALKAGDLPANALITVRARAPGIFAVVSMTLASDIGTYIAANFIISTAITIQIGGTAPAASTSGYPNYFATLQLAQNWLSQYRISSLGSVLLQFPGGSTGNNKIAINTSISFTHPDGGRITISGATPSGTTPNSASLQMTGNSAAQRASDNAANLAVCRSWLATELFLTNGSTISFGSQINVQNILFNCDGSKNAQGQPVDLVDFYGGGTSSLTNSAFFNASHYGFAASGATVFTGGTIIASGCAYPNIVAVGNGTVAPQGPLFSYSSGSHGVQALANGLFYPTQAGTAPCRASGNAGNGFHAVLATIDLGDASVPSYADYNSSGYYAYEGSKIYASGCEASNNATYGWAAIGAGWIEAGYTTGSGNGTCFYASVESAISRGGTTATGSTQASPAVGSVGNNNSTIS